MEMTIIHDPTPDALDPDTQEAYARKPKVYPCKVGTVPGLVVLWKNSKPKVGHKIKYRDDELTYGRWETGIVWKMHDDGYFFIDRM